MTDKVDPLYLSLTLGRWPFAVHFVYFGGYEMAQSSFFLTLILEIYVFLFNLRTPSLYEW